MGRKDESREPILDPDRSAPRNRGLEEALEQALTQLNNDAPIERILARYPAHAAALRSMLRAARAVRRVPPPAPDAAAKRAGLERLMAAVAAKRRARVVHVQHWNVGSVLDDAVAQLRDGEDIDSVLARYPAFALQLRPLLRVAEVVHSVPPPIPDEDAYFAGRARVVELAAQRRRQRQPAPAPAAPRRGQRLADVLAGFLGLAPSLRRAAITVVLLVAMIIGSFGVTQVAAGSLPTSPLYPVKRLTERVQLAFTPSMEARAKLHLRFSQERLREAELLARQRGQADAQVLEAMLAENDSFLGSIKEISPEERRDLLADGARLFYEQRRVLSELSGGDSPLTPAQRAMLTDYAGAAGDDQAIAEEVHRIPDRAGLIPTALPRVTATSATAISAASPTPAPTQAVEEVATPAPPSLTPSQAPPEPEVVMDSVPAQPVAPTATDTAAPAVEETPASTATSAPISTPPPADEPTAPPATPTTAPTEPAPSPTAEIAMPTLLPVATPAP